MFSYMETPSHATITSEFPETLNNKTIEPGHCCSEFRFSKPYNS